MKPPWQLKGVPTPHINRKSTTTKQAMKPPIPLSHQLGRRASSILVAVGLACALAEPALADLTHRYSFTTDASDSVGTAHGTAKGFVTFTDGEAVLPASVTSGDGSDYIELPPGLISNYTTVTFEFWCSPGANGVWSELYAFGNTNAGAGANMLMFCHKSGPDDYRMSYAGGDPGWTDEHVATGGGYLDNLGPLSIACVYRSSEQSNVSLQERSPRKHVVASNGAAASQAVLINQRVQRLLLAWPLLATTVIPPTMARSTNSGSTTRL